MNTILVTGGAGFIGSNFILLSRRADPVRIVNLDKLTYAGNMENLRPLADDRDHIFIRGDINDQPLVGDLLDRFKPRAVMNFAAESHVDRSILEPARFLDSNFYGVFNLLEASLRYWRAAGEPPDFRFHQISTDEVFGALGFEDAPFTESSRYSPNSPYAASKAGADHLVRSYFHTYGLPVLITNCSNNYGPRQFPEKLIPLMITNAVQGKQLPIYGDGRNVRDWIYVEDHCRATRQVLEQAAPGETYNIGGRSEKNNLEVVETLCDLLDYLLPDSEHRPHRSLIKFVQDRPGHDLRYAIDSDKMLSAFGWRPVENFKTGLEKTVRWYLDHPEWTRSILSGEYRNWIERNYRGR